MCGLGGIVTGVPGLLRPASHLQRMQQALCHRGPDDRGLLVLPEAGLGLVHARLSIIDLTSADHQPMWNDDHSIVLAYNGEVYNFAELRSELLGHGMAFPSAAQEQETSRGSSNNLIQVTNCPSNGGKLSLI
jgi:asparagine synthase (glutamine-hydrolysing)